MKRFQIRNPLFFLLACCLVVLCACPAVKGVVHPAVMALPALLFVATMPVISRLGIVRRNPLFFLAGQVGAVLIRDAMDQIRTIKYTHSAATTTDTVYLLNGWVLLAMNSAAANVLNVFMIGGILEYATATGTAWTAGDKIYWDDTNKVFTKTSTSNTLCGIAYEDKASAAATGCIMLIPTP